MFTIVIRFKAFIQSYMYKNNNDLINVYISFFFLNSYEMNRKSFNDLFIDT